MADMIQQPIEGAHPAKADVPGPPSTSAIAGENKREPANGDRHFTGEASLAPERDDRHAAENATWEPNDL